MSAGVLAVVLASTGGVAVGPRSSAAAAGAATSSTAAAAGARPSRWVTTWGGSAMSPSALVSTVQTLDDQTVRDIVYTSAGGTALRIRVSNAFGDRTVTIK